MKTYEAESRGPGKLVAITEFSKRHQHTSFSKFFQISNECYEKEIEDLRNKQKEYHKILYEKYKEDKDILVDDHV